MIKKSAISQSDCRGLLALWSFGKIRTSPIMFLLVVCFSLLVSQQAFGNTIGVGYFSGQTTGPVVNLKLSASNSLKIIAPMSFENIICDYQYNVKSITKGSFHIQLYLGIGTDVTLSGNKKDKAGGEFAASLRVPLGVAIRVNRFSADVFAELALSLQIYDGQDFNVDTGNIDRGKVGFGVRYYF